MLGDILKCNILHRGKHEIIQTFTWYGGEWGGQKLNAYIKRCNKCTRYWVVNNSGVIPRGLYEMLEKYQSGWYERQY